MAARDKAMNTWSKGKGVKDQVSDDEESGKDEETSMASKVRRKRRRTSEALQFLQVRSEKEAEARKGEISFKKEMSEKEAEARRGDTFSINERWLPLKQSARILYSNSYKCSSNKCSKCKH